MANAYDTIMKRLDAGQNITLDAATGTELQAKGVPMHPQVWCGMAHMTNPDEAVAVHSEYILAGADIITANTYSTNRNMMGPAGLGDEAMPATRRAVELAMQARDQTETDRVIAVAGSMSHQFPLTQQSSQRILDKKPTPEVAKANFKEMAETLAESGVDLLLMEMMYDPDLAPPAIEAAKATGLPVWIGTSARHGANGEVLATVKEFDFPYEELVVMLKEAGGDVFGIMHSHIPLIDPALEVLRKHFDGPLAAYPDGGMFTMPEWVFEGVIEPEDFATLAQGWFDSGVQIVGGCCGLGIKHIQAMHH